MKYDNGMLVICKCEFNFENTLEKENDFVIKVNVSFVLYTFCIIEFHSIVVNASNVIHRCRRYNFSFKYAFKGSDSKVFFTTQVRK